MRTSEIGSGAARLEARSLLLALAEIANRGQRVPGARLGHCLARSFEVSVERAEAAEDVAAATVALAPAASPGNSSRTSPLPRLRQRRVNELASAPAWPRYRGHSARCNGLTSQFRESSGRIRTCEHAAQKVLLVFRTVDGVSAVDLTGLQAHLDVGIVSGGRRAFGLSMVLDSHHTQPTRIETIRKRTCVSIFRIFLLPNNNKNTSLVSPHSVSDMFCFRFIVIIQYYYYYYNPSRLYVYFHEIVCHRITVE